MIKFARKPWVGLIKTQLITCLWIETIFALMVQPIDCCTDPQLCVVAVLKSSPENGFCSWVSEGKTWEQLIWAATKTFRHSLLVDGEELCKDVTLNICLLTHTHTRSSHTCFVFTSSTDKNPHLAPGRTEERRGQTHRDTPALIFTGGDTGPEVTWCQTRTHYHSKVGWGSMQKWPRGLSPHSPSPSLTGRPPFNPWVLPGQGRCKSVQCFPFYPSQLENQLLETSHFEVASKDS